MKPCQSKENHADLHMLAKDRQGPGHFWARRTDASKFDEAPKHFGLKVKVWGSRKSVPSLLKAGDRRVLLRFLATETDQPNQPGHHGKDPEPLGPRLVFGGRLAPQKVGCHQNVALAPLAPLVGGDLTE